MNVLLNGSSVSPAKAASITTPPEDSTRKAFAILEQVRKQNPALAEIKQFEPYVLRHIALTRLAEAGAGVCGVAKIAGHSTILITQSYVHEGADAIERAFPKREAQQRALALSDVPNLGGHKAGHSLRLE